MTILFNCVLTLAAAAILALATVAALAVTLAVGCLEDRR